MANPEIEEIKKTPLNEETSQWKEPVEVSNALYNDLNSFPQEVQPYIEKIEQTESENEIEDVLEKLIYTHPEYVKNFFLWVGNLSSTKMESREHKLYWKISYQALKKNIQTRFYLLTPPFNATTSQISLQDRLTLIDKCFSRQASTLVSELTTSFSIKSLPVEERKEIVIALRKKIPSRMGGNYHNELSLYSFFSEGYVYPDVGYAILDYPFSTSEERADIIIELITGGKDDYGRPKFSPEIQQITKQFFREWTIWYELLSQKLDEKDAQKVKEILKEYWNKDVKSLVGNFSQEEIPTIIDKFSVTLRELAQTAEK